MSGSGNSLRQGGGLDQWRGGGWVRWCVPWGSLGEGGFADRWELGARVLARAGWEESFEKCARRKGCLKVFQKRWLCRLLATCGEVGDNAASDKK